MKTVQALRKPKVIQRVAQPPRESISIAVVDDDMMYRQAIEVSLKKVPGSRVHGFDSGEACFKNYHSCKPDIFVLDYRLCSTGTGDVMNGIEVLRKVKQVNDDATVIFLSGAANTEVAVTAIKAGAADFIAKDKNGLARLLNQVRKASIRIQVKRQEMRVTRWIAAGALCIAAIVTGTILADSGGFSDFWNWFWFISSIVCGIIVIRAWVRRSRNDYDSIQTIEYMQNGKWID
jgi:FixJ family two-component response regulator